MNNEVPGCDVPESIMKRLRSVSDSKEDSRAEGIKIAREIFDNILPDIRGIQISAPFGNIQSVFDVLEGNI
jgi:homocysteine S-methyltransferase